MRIMNLKSLSFILDGSLKSFETLVDILDSFSYISGLFLVKLIKKKCQVLQIGSMIQNEVVYLNKRKFKWSSKEASSL